MVDFNDKLDDLTKVKKAHFQSEGTDYIHIRCGGCEFAEQCPMWDANNSGCGMRKQIYDQLFSKIEFKSDDPIATNRLRLIAKYYPELQLRRNLGIPLTPDESIVLKIVLSELSKLSIDKKGDLADQKYKAAVPWEQDAEVKKMKADYEEAMKMRVENERLRAELEKKRKERKDDDTSV